ncbi:ExeA family protein [Candidatus Latescibacterota bacterium]
MFLSYWGLNEKPFENTPDPRFLYYSIKHKEALLNLLYAVNENKGAALLTGDVGCGKTLIARTLIGRLDPSEYEVALITNPRFDEDDFVKEILFQFGIEISNDSKIDLLHTFNDFLFNNARSGRYNVLIIDEAQLIINKLILEEIRLLLNFQLDDRFLLTIILIGQPELKKTVRSMPQLDQRIGIRYHIEHLSMDDTKHFIIHRLRVAGREQPIFTDDAVRHIYEYSKGIPRKINNICDLCLVMGVARGLQTINYDVVNELTAAERD